MLTVGGGILDAAIVNGLVSKVLWRLHPQLMALLVAGRNFRKWDIIGGSRSWWHALEGYIGELHLALSLCFLAPMISSCPLLYTTLVLPHCRPRAVGPVTTRIQSKPSLSVGCLPKAFCHHSRELSQVLRPTVALMHPLAAVGWFCSILMAVAIWNREEEADSPAWVSSFLQGC